MVVLRASKLRGTTCSLWGGLPPEIPPAATAACPCQWAASG